MDQARSTCNGGTSQPPKRRKRYLEPGETYSLPRTSLRYQERVQDSQSSLQTPQQQSLRSSGAGSANAGVCNNYLSCEISDNDDFDASDQNLYHAESDEGDSNKQYDSESSSAEDCSGAEECEGDGDEFCRLFSSECLPNSDMSVRDAMLTLMAYTASVGLNWTDMEKLVGVINLFLGKPVLPTSSYMLRKVWKQWMGGLVERHYFSRAAVLNMKQYNGYFGCSFCLHRGVHIRDPNIFGRGEIFPVSWQAARPPLLDQSVCHDSDSVILEPEEPVLDDVILDEPEDEKDVLIDENQHLEQSKVTLLQDVSLLDVSTLNSDLQQRVDILQKLQKLEQENEELKNHIAGKKNLPEGGSACGALDPTRLVRFGAAFFPALSRSSFLAAARDARCAEI
ncbi:hypothetical protein HPB49_025707 [Dermacentor silvarum]|nr:hypothetical protein HPB49_025707 [Dermacentor silvarum]